MDWGDIGSLVVGIISILMLAFAGYFAWLLLKAIVVVPVTLVGAGVASRRHRLEIDEDPRIAGTNHETERLQRLIETVQQHVLTPKATLAPQPAKYRSVLGFLPASKVPGLLDSEDFEFFDDQRKQDVYFTYQTLVPNQLVSTRPELRDLAAIVRPRQPTVNDALEVTGQAARYPVNRPAPPKPQKIPDFGPIPTSYDVLKPVLKLDGRLIQPGQLNHFQRSAFDGILKRYERLLRAWGDLRDEHQEFLGKLKNTFVALKERLDRVNQASAESYAAACSEFDSGMAIWTRAREEELDLLQSLTSEFRAAYNDDQAKNATLTLDYLVMPKWLPICRSASFDEGTGILIVEQEFPDIGRIEWVKDVTTAKKTVEKPASKVESKDANERLYPALALRYAYEVARAVDPAKVDTIVLNGWADYIDRTTGEMKRAYVLSLLAKRDYLTTLNLPQIDVIQAFNALKGVTARSQTITPVAPIVRLNTNDRRFVDAKAVLDDVGDQNLATMDWGDFEHLCRELFEREFASAGAEVKITQASRDQGVDAVIFDPHPIRGGKIVIQAKRYAGTVDVSAVRDLWGTTQHEGAMKGILVTTSSFGSDAYNFIAGKPLTLINGGELLQILETHGYKFRIDLAEAKKAARERYGGVRTD